MLEAEGHDVTVIDSQSTAFARLPGSFRGRKLVGNGIDQDVLRRAGIDRADAFVACTQGDNRNVMAAQIAQQIFRVPRVVLRIYDPIREEMYHELGLHTTSPTKLGANALLAALKEEE
jgi:trk system potassium uptake protein TrkA